MSELVDPSPDEVFLQTYRWMSLLWLKNIYGMTICIWLTLEIWSRIPHPPQQIQIKYICISCFKPQPIALELFCIYVLLRQKSSIRGRHEYKHNNFERTCPLSSDDPPPCHWKPGFGRKPQIKAFFLFKIWCKTYNFEKAQFCNKHFYVSM